MKKARGAASILTIFVGVIAIGAFASLGMGQMMWQKTEIQRIADVAATTAASEMGNASSFAEAYAIATKNGAKTGEVVITAVDSNTAKATVTRSITPFFFLGSRSIVAIAQAQTTPLIAGSLRSTVANVDTNQSLLLNGLLNAVGGSGSNINLPVASFNGLINGGLALSLLDLQTKLGVASVQQLLGTTVKLGDFLNAAVSVANGGDKTTATVAVNTIQTTLNAVSIPVGNLLNVGVAQADAAKASLNLGALALTTILAAADGRAASVNLGAGALGLTAKVYVVEPPQMFVGKKIPGVSPIAYSRTAQVKVELNISQGLSLPPLGIPFLASVSISALQMSLYVQAGGGDVTVTDIQCKIPRSNTVTTFKATSSLANICLSSTPSNFADNNTIPITCGGAANIASVTATILGISVPIAVKLGASAKVASATQTITKTGTAPYTFYVPFSASQGLGTAIQNLDIDPQLTVGPLTFLIQGTVNLLLDTLQPVLVTLISPILQTVGAIVDSLLKILGISLNDVYVDVKTLNCSATRLTK